MPHDPSTHERRLAEQHEALEGLLGAYADGELPPAQVAELDAHLLACARCRRQLELSSAVDRALASEVLVPASPRLRARVLAATRAPAVAEPPSPAPRRTRPAWERPLAWGGWLVAAGLALLLVAPRQQPARVVPPPAPPPVPMAVAAAADFRRSMGTALPGTPADLAGVRAALPFAVVPLSAPGLELLGAWRTSIRGEAAAALAYRWRDRVVVQYVVPEALFTRQPGVRQAVAERGLYAATDSGAGVVAWPGERSGILLVGAVAADELARLREGVPAPAS